MLNIGCLVAQVFVICGLSVLTLKLGEKALNSWLCLVAIAMNLFVTKSVDIGNLSVTATDSLAVGYMLGLALIQENFGRHAARQHVLICFIVSVGFALLSSLHLLYEPNEFDVMHGVFVALLRPMPRLLFASLASFLLIQLMDIAVFQWLRTRWEGKCLSLRTGICLTLSQICDTVVFSYLGLWGLVPNLWHVILLSLAVKMCVVVLSTPFVELSKIKLKFPWKHKNSTHGLTISWKNTGQE
jgi:uncharacterized integral membrane protein (TIGR00697 family)